MSSMSRPSLFTRSGCRLVMAASLALPMALPGVAHADSSWDEARARLLAQPRGDAAWRIEQWRNLSSSDRGSFTEYAGFLLANPGFPDETKIRGHAEAALVRGGYDPREVIALFDRHRPMTATGGARYAMALLGAGRRGDAMAAARAAWRLGPIDEEAEIALLGAFAGSLSPEDHDARMDALLWAGATSAAERQLGLVSPGRRPLFTARLALARGGADAANAGQAGADALADAGYVWQRARYLRQSGQGSAAQALLANRPPLAVRPVRAERWLEELLANARAAAAAGDHVTAFRIASRLDDAFAPGADISNESLGVRDDYTSLAWLAGTEALWDAGRPREAAASFAAYGNAAKTPQTRSKGFYWAGRAAAQAGDRAAADRYFAMAGAYADHFYGQLALERLGKPLPRFDAMPDARPEEAERRAFAADPLTGAVREVARTGSWRDQIRFYRAISDKAQGEGQHQLVAELAREIGRRDLAVILGQSAAAKGLTGWQAVAFPQMPVPAGHEGDTTIIHAITRQESQFAPDAVSHAGARGLMQLMPGTAREQAGKFGMSYQLSSLIDDPQYNIRLGSGYFARMMSYYNGAYPLAIAAYNAGPGNVNKWLRANGDPRNGGIDWVQWIERIPIYETRNYVVRVIENAVVYDAMNPQRAVYRGPHPVSHYLGKRTPG